MHTHTHTRCSSNCSGGRVLTFLAIVILCHLNFYLVPPVSGQPFLNSLLPVLFRERPNWTSNSNSNSNSYSNSKPATSSSGSSSGTLQFFPTSIRHVAPIVASGSSHQGILIAHPILTTRDKTRPPMILQAYNHNRPQSQSQGSQKPQSLYSHTPTRQVTNFFPQQQQYSNQNHLQLQLQMNPSPSYQSPPAEQVHFGSAEAQNHPLFHENNNHLEEEDHMAVGDDDGGHPPYNEQQEHHTHTHQTQEQEQDFQNHHQLVEDHHNQYPHLVPPPIDFRPSPQILAPLSMENDNIVDFSHSDVNLKSFESKVNPSGSVQYESGFVPISSGWGKFSHLKSVSSNEKFHYPSANLSHLSAPVKKHRKPGLVASAPVKAKENSSASALRQDRQIVTASVSKSVVTTAMATSVDKSKSFGHTPSASTSKAAAAARKPVYTKAIKTYGKGKGNSSNSVTDASSSDRIEDWIKVEGSSSSTNENEAEPLLSTRSTVSTSRPNRSKFPLFTRGNKLQLTRPVKCEFHRYGFCGVDSHYPKKDVEKIASRCYALLTHIIAPQVKYNLATASNGTIRERYSPGKRHNQRGWSWKTYQGNPICNYLELTVAPGWAKDELGDWVVILQTPEWKQEAQVSICTSSRASECSGPSCNKTSSELLKTRCVQRFAAQRLAVLDPGNQDRCPIIKSVFLPSACICINSGANASSDERLDTSSSEISHISHVMKPGSNDTTFMIVTEKMTINENR